MGEWVDTSYGRRYKEEYGETIAFFKTKSRNDGPGITSEKILNIILEDKVLNQFSNKLEEVTPS